MTDWDYLLATVRAGQEFDTATAINEAGGLAVAPRKVELTRHATHHKWGPVESPILPNYVFCAVTPAAYHAAIRMLGRDGIRPRTAMRFDKRQWAKVQAYAQRAEADYQVRMGQIEGRKYISPYNPGDALQLLGGALIGRMVRFAGVTYEAGNPHPLIAWEADMMGQVVRGTSSALDVTRAAE